MTLDPEYLRCCKKKLIMNVYEGFFQLIAYAKWSGRFLMAHVITGKNLDLGKALHEYVEDALSKLRVKYRLTAFDAHVVFQKTTHHKFLVHLTLPLDKAHALRLDNEDSDIYRAVRGVFMHAEKGIRRYKERLDDHHKHHDNHKFITKNQGPLSA